MDELKQRLAKDLNKNRNTTILKSMEWSLPVRSLEVSFQTVKRSKMDILMKMMLITFQKAKIREVEDLSELLLVDPLFIEDLIDKMLRTNMIEKKSSYFELTEAGIEQLETGIFISERKTETKIARYSPCHESFFIREIKTIPNNAQKMYRYADVFDDWNVTSLDKTIVLETLQTLGIETDIGNVQVVIVEITDVIEVAIEQVPCIEFQLHNTAEDIIYARVWNTLLAEWDATLEAQLNEKERLKWLKDRRK